MRQAWYFAGLLLMLIGCSRGEKITIEDLRQREIDRRVAQFVVNKESECYENTMEKAVAIADSLLKLNAVKYVEDSLRRPDLPSKPHLIIKPPPKDSIRPRPFIHTDTVQ